MRHFAASLVLLCSLVPVAAQTPNAEPVTPVTEVRLLTAYADARAACEKVLGAALDELPPLKLVATSEVAAVITAENLPAVRLRQPDETKALAEADQFGKHLAPMIYAKYAWSSRSLLVVPKTWESNARLLKRPQLTSDQALRAVLVHELCHALDDRRFDFGKRLLEATTTDAMTAYSAVIEGHAQLTTRRVCAASGWSDGFDVFTDSIGALPVFSALAGEATTLLLRATAAATAAAYVDGERFATAVLTARPDTGAKDLFESPPKDPETILRPQWYLDPTSRPALLYDAEPALDAFVAKFDPVVWSSSRSTTTAKQLATGLTMLPQAEVDAVLASLRAVRLVHLAPTAAPQSKVAILVVMEFDSEDAARRWVDVTKRVSDHKDATMDKGMVRITASKTTPIDHPLLQGWLQQKTMKNGRLEFEVATIDASKGRVVLETIYSGEPPAADEHLKIVAELAGLVARRQ